MGTIKQPNELEQILMKRDKMTLSEVRELIRDARRDLKNYDDPDQFMYDWFGLEPDYLVYVV